MNPHDEIKSKVQAYLAQKVNTPKEPKPKVETYSLIVTFKGNDAINLKAFFKELKKQKVSHSDFCRESIKNAINSLSK